MRSPFKAVNSFQPSKHDKELMETYAKEFKYKIWVPESFAGIGDIVLFYNNVEDFAGGIGWDHFYRWIKQNPKLVKE
jgi:hypothetical protein